jgi:hypothetical protein
MVSVSRWQALPACLGLVVLVFALIVSSPGSASAETGLISDTVPMYQLLPPIQDPDDDNDGVDDADDQAPDDPAVAPEPPPDILSPIDDSDGDGIPNIQDPDDDNGGTSDEDDPAPFDPVIEPTPAPDILSPIDDSDGDGIPNIQDPDDDNDAVQDDEDAAPFVPGTDDPDPPTKAPPAAHPAPAANTSSGNPPVVTALPVTGSGGDDGGWRMVWTIAIAGAGYVGLGVLARIRDVRAPREGVK